MLKKKGKTFNLSEGLTPLIKRHKEEGLGRKSLKLHHSFRSVWARPIRSLQAKAVCQ